MNNYERRLRAIEVTLTPQQIVVLWLGNAQQAGTFEEARRQSPFPREAVANAILKTVRAGMPVIQRAILQARQEGDLLYSEGDACRTAANQLFPLVGSGPDELPRSANPEYKKG